MPKPRKVHDIEELLSILQTIGNLKNDLPLRLRDWISILGLYVQLRFAGGWERLEAGGRFRSYFDALCRDPTNVDALFGKATAWEIRQFDRETWDRRFAHLVLPTAEIALFVSGSNMFQKSGSQFDKQAVATLMGVVQHFKATGEWLSLPSSHGCASCGQRITIEQWQGESCPHCGGHLRETK
jgi:hypothetical protein